MNKKKKVSVVFGTRPEAIKLCPVVIELKKRPEFEVSVCITAQHRQMLDQVLEVFGVVPDVDLNLMQPNQTLAGLTAKAITGIDSYFSEFKPDIVLVQGDTTTVFATALVAFYHKIQVGHVEAGLRTWNKFSPFPEEMNRVLATKLADYYFAPTEWSQENLLKEGIAPERIFVTGNTVVDALKIAVEKVKNVKISIPGLPAELMAANLNKDLVLITGHRRENFGANFESLCRAISTLAGKYPDKAFVYPVHMNPNVREPVNRILGNKKNIHLIEPLGYLDFIALMNRSKLILTDSGGIQEEAPTLGKPVLI
ncbi:MAG: UDP-N-acetylglucosamine 2-epimerase (non-hydrolyzing), partial [Fibrobacteres bacterium]|nr:UDP-N-acetylglucosamine 2-epimerase (non-hydrolyzing) [Fibrobacterota bacterium]